MTEKLYYQDSFMTSFEARITEVRQEEEGVFLCLDRTAFYPEGGGQGPDHGTLMLPDNTLIPVTDVQEKDGKIWHRTDPGSFAAEPGAAVSGRIDWERRFDHMQQHSGEHIVSGMICRKYHCDNVGFHLGEDLVTIDFNVPLTMEQVLWVEEKANAYIWENHPVEILFPSAKELKNMEYRSKKELTGDVRIVRFPDADQCACCGTHVLKSAQVGLVKFISAKPFHEGVRLELLCGKRAAAYLSMNYRVNKAAAVLLSTSEENTAEHVEKLLEENLRLRALASSLEDKLLRLRAESYRDQGNVLLIEEQMSGQQARTLADLTSGVCGGMAAVFAKDKDRYQYAVIRKGADISDFIKQMNQALHGRGGGRDGFAQGAVAAEKEEIERWFQDNF